MSGQLSYNEEPKPYLEEVSAEVFAQNQAEMTNGWNIAETVLPLAVGAAALLRVDIGSVVAEAPKDVPDPVKGLAVGAVATALTWAGVRAARWVKDRVTNHEPKSEGPENYINETS